MLVCGVFVAPDAAAPFATPQAATDALTAATTGPVKAFTDLAAIDVTAASTALEGLKTAITPYATSTVAAIKTAYDDAFKFYNDSKALLATAPKKADEAAKFTTAQGLITTAITAAGQALALKAISDAKAAATTALGTLPASIAAANTALTNARKAFEDIAKDPMFGTTPPAMPWAGAAAAPATTAPTTTAPTTTAPAATTPS